MANQISGGNVTMLSSTSLLHANCIFNRNNTVATQQGMKTYWLCKSYRITMCRARCITHQGRVLSATGVHNHQPHMKGSYPNSEFVQSGNTTTCATSNGNSISISMRLPSSIPVTTVTTQSHSSSPTSQSILPATSQHQEVPHSQHHLNNENQTQEPPNHTVTTNVHHSPPSNHQHHSHHSEHPTSSSHANNNSTSLQNMMQNVLSQNNLMQLTNMTPILNPMHNHSHMAHLHSSHLSNELHVTPSQNHENNENNENLHSPDSPRSSMHHAQLVRHQMTDDVNRMTQHHSHSTGTMHGQQQQQQHHHHHHHQSNENNSPVGLSPIETPPHRSQLTSESDSNVHHSLANEMTSSSSFKLEQI
ncbi:histidine-rich glycoprotein-like [Contarinia nasturtii]|uniref:histidine-rich glycoprotein-like n=1 Tax=Contarinia nasturtii TaxID=265458 RepID=UPI0012D3916D|nr:histidine-rich glycoprotein-like [Contarinia nasturtii]